MDVKKKNEIVSVVWETVRSHALLSVAMVLAIVGTIATGVFPPLVLEGIVNRLAGRKPLGGRIIVVYFLLLTAAGLFDAGKESLITVFGQKVTHRLRSVLCAKLARLPAAYYTAHEPGVTVSRFVGDVDTVETLFASGIISMAVDVCKVVSIVAVIFVKSRGLGVLLLVALPVLFALTRMFQKRMLGAQIANREVLGKVNNHIPETIQNIRMIHTLRKEKFMEDRYDRFIEESYRHVEKSNFYDAVYSPLIVTVGAVLVAVMMVLSARGGKMQIFFGMSVGTAVAVINYVGKVFDPIESIGMEIQNIQSAVAGICRIREFLEEPERAKQNHKMVALKQASAADRNCPAVEIDGVTFGYEKEQDILHHYSLRIVPGEHITLIGRTGVGKSTIFRLILGLYQPWEGKVLIFGTDANQIPDVQKRRVFGYVEQTFKMIPGTVRDQITLGDTSVSDGEAEHAMRMVGMEEAVLKLDKGYDTPCTEELFSQGQMQLLSIARAVAADPLILLLDEVTANLDSATEQSVLEALGVASENRTVISISNRLYEQSGGRKIQL